MKNFDEFRSSLTEDDIANIADNAQQVLNSARDTFTENPKTSLGNQIATTSLFISLGLLERYHEWLQQDS